MSFAHWLVDHRHQRAVRRILEDAGATFSTELEAKDRAFKRLGLLDTLPDGAKGVVWCASLKDGDTSIELLSHRYWPFNYRIDKFRLPRRRIITSVAVPADWPPLVVSSEHQFYFIDTTGRRNAMKLDSARFNKRWRVQAHDENFGLVFLTRDVQEWFMRLPRGTIVHVGLGVMTVSIERLVSPRNILEFARLPSGLLRMLCPELQAEVDGSVLQAA